MIFFPVRNQKRRMNVARITPACLISASLVVFFGSGCYFGSGDVVITKLPATKPQTSRSQQFSPEKYESILVILPDAYRTDPDMAAGSATPATDIASDKTVIDPNAEGPHLSMTLSRSRDYDFVVNEAERFLLQNGFSLISRDVIGRIDDQESQRFSKRSLYLLFQSPTEKALLLGRKTNADALLIIDHLGCWASEQHFVYNPDTGVFDNLPRAKNAKGPWVSISLYEVTIQMKLIDVENGEVLWMGSGRVHSRNLFPEDWRGTIKVRGDEVTTEEENFEIEDYKSYNFLYKQVARLVRDVLTDLVSMKTQ